MILKWVLLVERQTTDSIIWVEIYSHIKTLGESDRISMILKWVSLIERQTMDNIIWVEIYSHIKTVTPQSRRYRNVTVT